MTRVVVTGMGIISPIGESVEEFWNQLTAGTSGIQAVTDFDAMDLPVRIAGLVPAFDPKRYMDKKTAQHSSRFVQFAMAAASQAVSDSGIEFGQQDPYRVGVVMNTGAGGMQDIAWGSQQLRERGIQHISPYLVPSLIPNMAACQVAIRYAAKGPVIASTAACAAGIYALIEARRSLLSGEADVVITGAAEAALMPLTFGGLSRMGALSRRNDEPTRASRPFDRDRDGFVFGEGSGVMVLEREEDARARGAHIYAELAGGAITNDAYHMAAPDPSAEPQARAMEQALKQAQTDPKDVDYICAHGTGTVLNDAVETKAIKRVFGQGAYRVPISSPKSMIGHLLGAAGMVSAVTAIQTLITGTIPPTINLETPDPQCDLDYVPQHSRRQKVEIAMANGFGFGGQNGVVVFRRV